MAEFPKQEQFSGESPSRSKVNRHPDDIRLRAAGFVLVGRPEGRPAVWRRRKETFTQDEALRLVRAEAEEEAAARKAAKERADAVFGDQQGGETGAQQD